MNDRYAQPEARFPAPRVVAAWERRAFLVGGVFSVAAVIGWILESEQFYRAYLLGYMLCFGLTLGCLAVLMLYHLTGGAWGTVIRRTLEAGTRIMPVMAALFIPVLIGVHRLYPWARPEVVAKDEHLQHIGGQYLNVKFFLFRAVLYFAIWILLALVLNRISRRQDEPPELTFDRRLRRIGGVGLVLYGFTMTLAAVDWVMSVDPHWASTIYGLLFMAGQGLVAFSFAVVLAAVLLKYEPMQAILRRGHFHDIGKLMLAFVMVWGYFAFSQWLIIWSGNLPDEIAWYMNRSHGGWQYVAAFLVLGQFALPFVLLLSRSLKQTPPTLFKLGLWIIFMRYVDLLWVIMPSFPERAGHFHYSWLDAVVPIALAGIWLALFFRNLRTRPLLALYDGHVRVLLEEEAHEHERRAS